MRQAIRQSTAQTSQFKKDVVSNYINLKSTTPASQMCACISPDLQDEKFYNLKFHYTNNPINALRNSKYGHSTMISPAQVERIKTNMGRLNLSVDKNQYELIKRLELLAVRYNSSVPMVLNSWLNRDTQGIRIKLSSKDIRYLDESI